MNSEGEKAIFEYVWKVIEAESAKSVLEISGFDERCAEAIHNEQTEGDCGSGAAMTQETEAAMTQKTGTHIIIDRVDLTDSFLAEKEDCSQNENIPYRKIYGSEILGEIDSLECYDVIIVLHLFENMDAQDAKDLLEGLLTKINRQVLVVTPEYPYDLTSDDENRQYNIRAYHPIFFLGMDFYYFMASTPGGRMQYYSFFPKIKLEPMACDKYLEKVGRDGWADTRYASTKGKGRTHGEARKKLKIAYIIYHHHVTGGMISIYRQMKELAKLGHTISAYHRSDTAKSALPEFSLLTEEEVPRQVVIPEDDFYIDHIGDEDIIILSWMQMVFEFRGIENRVALWEQGTPSFFGDYDKFISSGAWHRKHLRDVYRMPVHLLAVSPTVQKVLHSMYNRRAQFFPNGIDTDFFHPAENKNNEVPIILLIGNPIIIFKGFGYMFEVLNTAQEMGMKFKVQIASPFEFAPSKGPMFNYETYIDVPQEELAELYRNADICMSASLYESFGLPPLEAMASGTAVIAMDCGGINTYAEPGVNCLLCEQGDTFSMVYALGHLLTSPEAREELAKAGRETALRYSFETIAPKLEECLYKIVEG